MTTPVNRSALSAKGLAHLSVVYVVWGSTYLAIRLAVREGAGFPPFALGAIRVLIAGGLLVAWEHGVGCDSGSHAPNSSRWRLPAS